MDSETFEIETGDSLRVADVTDRARRFCEGRGDGLLSVFLPHATAGLAIIETGAGTEDDLVAAVDDTLPAEEGRWRHAHGSAGHGRDHVLPAFVAPSVTVPVLDGRMQLGTWQSLVVVDTNVDNRTRTVRMSFLAG